MDLLSRIASWLGENEATISAVAAILAIVVILFTGLRFLLRRRTQTVPEPTTKTSPEEDPLLALPTGPVVAVLPIIRVPQQEEPRS